MSRAQGGGAVGKLHHLMCQVGGNQSSKIASEGEVIEVGKKGNRYSSWFVAKAKKRPITIRKTRSFPAFNPTLFS